MGKYGSDSYKICLKCVKKTNIKTPVKHVHAQKSFLRNSKFVRQENLLFLKKLSLIIFSATERNKYVLIFIKISNQKLESAVKKSVKNIFEKQFVLNTQCFQHSSLKYIFTVLERKSTHAGEVLHYIFTSFAEKHFKTFKFKLTNNRLKCYVQ